MKSPDSRHAVATAWRTLRGTAAQSSQMYVGGGRSRGGGGACDADNAALVVVCSKPRCAMAVHGPRKGLAPHIPAELDAGVYMAARPSMDGAYRYDALARARPYVPAPLDVVVEVIALAPLAALLGGHGPRRHSRGAPRCGCPPLRALL